MSVELRRALLIAGGGLVCCTAALALVRLRLMSLRYTLGWLTIGVTGVVAAFLTDLVEPLANRLGMSPTGLLLASSTAVLLAITMQLSISVSGLQSQVRALAEEHALLADRLEPAEEPARE